MSNEPLTQVNALAATPEKEKEVSRGAKVVGWMADNGIFVFTAVLIAAALIGVDGFASLQNITDVFHRAAPIGIVAVGMTFVVISGNYLDLSVVAQVATAAVILIAVSNEYGYFAAIIAAMLAAAMFGLGTGVVIKKLAKQGLPALAVGGIVTVVMAVLALIAVQIAVS